MVQVPIIVVQMIHIEGPLKGQIQEFSESVIPIGRHPSCLMKYPADLTVVSRKHATVLRDGNRFKVVDSSSNGTFVNGKRVKEVYLENGDVLTISEGGPKVSFLTEIREGVPEPPSGQSTPPEGPSPPLEPLPASPPPAPEPPRPPVVSCEPAAVPLVIQFGPTIRSYKQLPVQIGSHPGCDFSTNHPGILERHAEISFSQNQYWVKDLTGRGSIRINGLPIQQAAPLDPDNEITLSPMGPTFRFLGEGRLAEVEPPDMDQSQAPPVPEAEKAQQEKSESLTTKGPKSLFRKVLRR